MDYEKVDELRKEWDRLARISQGAADAVGASVWCGREAQRYAIAAYTRAYKAADHAFALYMAEMGDRRALDAIETEQRREQALLEKVQRVDGLRREWGIFAPLIDLWKNAA